MAYTLINVDECLSKVEKMKNGGDRNCGTQKGELATLLVSLIVVLGLMAFWKDEILDFIYRYFIRTIGLGYNPVNTVVYSVILAVSILMVARLLMKLKVEPDERFILSTSPYIVIGSAGRALRDLGFFNSFFFVSPLIFFLVFAYALPCLVISLFAGKKINKPYQAFFLIFGTIPASYLVYQVAINVVEQRGASNIILWTTAIALITFPIMYLVDRLVTDEPLLNTV